MTQLKFETLWRNYPRFNPSPGVDNPCAMRVGRALELSGVSLVSFQGSLQAGTTVGAQELADWLGPARFPGCPSHETLDGSEVFDRIAGRSGILFMANYRRRPGDADVFRRGEHIDLWNGSRMTECAHWLRVHLGVSWDGHWSGDRVAPRTWFWSIA